MNAQRITPDELREAVANAAKPKVCNVYTFLTDPANQEYVESLYKILFSYEISQSQSRRILKLVGLPMGGNKLTEHREDKCQDCTQLG